MKEEKLMKVELTEDEVLIICRMLRVADRGLIGDIQKTIVPQRLIKITSEEAPAIRTAMKKLIPRLEFSDINSIHLNS